MSINQRVWVNDDGVRRLGYIVQIEDDYIWVQLASRTKPRRFWAPQVRTV